MSTTPGPLPQSALSAEQQAFIREHYPAQGTVYCATHLGLAEGSVRWFCSSQRIVMAPEARRRVQRPNLLAAQAAHRLNHPARVKLSAFTENLTPAAAYVLGFIWADGYVYQPYRIVVECVADDIDVLEPTFRQTGEWVRSDRRRNGRRPQAMLATSNADLAAHLVKHGHGPNSFGSACGALATVPESLHRYWFRGLVDGDGCFYQGSAGASQFCVAGAFGQDWSYIEQLLTKLGIPYTIQRTVTKAGHRSSAVRVTKAADIARLGAWLYEGYPDDGIGLPRKHAKWLAIVEQAKRIAEQAKRLGGITFRQRSGRWEAHIRPKDSPTGEIIRCGAHPTREAAVAAQAARLTEVWQGHR